MPNPYNMPSLQSPVVDPQGKITQLWAGLLRDYLIGLKAEKAPGRIESFYLSAADLADDTKFVQAGATAGLGVGDYLGWALCNGSNGTPNIADRFVRLSLVAAGLTGGSDSSAHTHDRGAHAHASGTLTAELTGWSGTELVMAVKSCANWVSQRLLTITSNVADATKTANTGLIIDGSTASDGSGNTGAASATDNKPAYFSLVPMMRV